MMHFNFSVTDLPRDLPKFYLECFAAWCKLAPNNVLNEKHVLSEIIAQLRRAKRASGAPWLRNFGNLSMREILVMTSAYAHPRVQTVGDGKCSPKAARPGVGGGE